MKNVRAASTPDEEERDNLQNAKRMENSRAVRTVREKERTIVEMRKACNMPEVNALQQKRKKTTREKGNERNME